MSVVDQTRDELAALQALRADVRELLAEQRAAGGFVTKYDGWSSGWNPEFSQRLARRGWVGMTIPTELGGRGRTHIERFVVGEELLAAGAPVAAHWVTERQIAPMLLALGTEEQQLRFLPGIAQAEISFALGMSEPGSGSDLASVRTRATQVDGGWLLNGQKIWTTSGHRADHIVVLCRTGEGITRHAGLSQLIVDRRGEGVQARPIPASVGNDHFAEIFFEDAFVPDENVLGQLGDGWRQVTAELGFERGGADRYMSNVPLLEAYLGGASSRSDDAAPLVGELVARLVALRSLAMGVIEAAEAGRDFAGDAALSKDAGNVYEQDTVAELWSLGAPDGEGAFDALLRDAILGSPGITLRGGSTEVLRGITAKRLVGR